jgi:CelD/BcsL family acetyltransferase involved in cellulose biosynthesis
MHSPASGSEVAGSSIALRTEIIPSFEALMRHRDAWIDLLGQSLCDQVTLSPLWLGAWWKLFGPLGGRRLCACLFWDGPELVGLAPLLRRWNRARSGIPFARVELLATGEPEADEIASDYVGVIARRGREQSVAEALGDLLVKGRLGHWDDLHLSALDASVPTARHLETVLRRAGLPARFVEQTGSPYIPLPENFDAYLAALDGQARYFVRRSQRDYESWAGARSRQHQVETAKDLANGIRILMQLHAERWRGEGHEGVFASGLFRAFHEAVLPDLLARGGVDLRYLTVDDEPVAVNYCFIWSNRVQFYQGGRALSVPKKVRPGIVLHLGAIRAAIQARRTEYDFLAGESQYKRQMALATRPMGRLVVERPGVRRFVHEAAARTWRWFKQRRAAARPSLVSVA